MPLNILREFSEKLGANQAGIYLSKSSKETLEKGACTICSKLTMKKLAKRH